MTGRPHTGTRLEAAPVAHRRRAAARLLAVVGAMSALLACTPPDPRDADRSTFEYMHPPLGDIERRSARTLLDSVAQATVAGDRATLQKLSTTGTVVDWALQYRGIVGNVSQGELTRGYWVRRGADTAWVHYAIPSEACSARTGTPTAQSVFVLIRLARSWRLVDGWLSSC